MSYSHETLWEAFGDGREAFRRGETFTSNPYSDSAEMTDSWQQGWLEAEKDSWANSFWETDNFG